MEDETEQSEDEPAELRSEVHAQISLQMARQHAYGDDDYELDEWEGFHCTECDWRGLSAPMYSGDGWEDDEGNLLATECPECGAPGPETSNERTHWGRVLEKLVNGPAEISLLSEE